MFSITPVITISDFKIGEFLRQPTIGRTMEVSRNQQAMSVNITTIKIMIGRRIIIILIVLAIIEAPLREIITELSGS